MKITKEIKERIQELKKQEKSAAEIARILNLPTSTVYYHYNKKNRAKTIERVKKYQKKNKLNRNKEKYKQYQKEYRNKKYKEDSEFRENQKERSRNYWRNKNGN